MNNPFKVKITWPTGSGAVRTTRTKGTAMTRTPREGTTSGIEPPEDPCTRWGGGGSTSDPRYINATSSPTAKDAEIERLRNLLCDKWDVLINAHAEIAALTEQLAEAVDEIRVLRSIIDADNDTEQAYLDAFAKRHGGVNAADNWRAL